MAAAHLPTKLSHCLQGHPPAGPNAFEWCDGRLRYSLASRDRDFTDWERLVEPPQARWEAFWIECDRIGVWDLPAEFSKPWIFDGLEVHTELEYRERAIRIRGQCADEAAEVTNAVRAFHRALQVLVGYKPGRDAES